jgi:hypothetical protein
MSGFNAFTYNNNPIINSFSDIASINLPTTQTYTVSQFNILAPTIDGTPGYVLQTNNNIISIDNSGGFSINNTGIYTIKLCFSFDYSNTGGNQPSIADFMLNSSPLNTSADLVGTQTILNVNASGTPLAFFHQITGIPLSDTTISTSSITIGPGNEGISYLSYMNPNIMYSTDPVFLFARYYLSTLKSSSTCVPQVLYFESTVNVTSTSDQSNYFYPCIAPYNFTFWNSGNNNLPPPYLLVQMISDVPAL